MAGRAPRAHAHARGMSRLIWPISSGLTPASSGSIRTSDSCPSSGDGSGAGAGVWGMLKFSMVVSAGADGELPGGGAALCGPAPGDSPSSLDYAPPVGGVTLAAPFVSVLPPGETGVGAGAGSGSTLGFRD